MIFAILGALPGTPGYQYGPCERVVHVGVQVYEKESTGSGVQCLQALTDWELHVLYSRGMFLVNSILKRIKCQSELNF